jgi:hypothetical protein
MLANGVEVYGTGIDAIQIIISAPTVTEFIYYYTNKIKALYSADIIISQKMHFAT